MKEEERKKWIELRDRFVKDTKLPIPVIEDDSAFGYFLYLYEKEFKAKTRWKNLCDLVYDVFNGNPGEYLAAYYELKDIILEDIKNSAEYKAFNELDMNQFAIPEPYRSIPQMEVYKETNDGKVFMSVDLKKANFQALKLLSVLNYDTYDDFILQYTALRYFKESKYIRQVIFGNCNPKRQVTFEKFLMYEVAQRVNGILEKISDKFHLISLVTDEAIFQFDGTLDELAEIAMKYQNGSGESIFNEVWKMTDFEGREIEVATTLYQIKLLKYRKYNGKYLSCYAKVFVDKKYELKKVPGYYFAQVYKLYNGEDITMMDRYFVQDNEVAMIIHPLRKDKPEVVFDIAEKDSILTFILSELSINSYGQELIGILADSEEFEGDSSISVSCSLPPFYTDEDIEEKKMLLTSIAEECGFNVSFP